MMGAQGISSLPPGGVFSFEEVKRYYATLAKATRLPLYVYHFPAMGGMRMTEDEVIDLCAMEGVAGLKCTDMNLYLLWRLATRGVQVLNGHDEVLAAGLMMGARGGIGSFYNLVPGWFLGLYKSALAGDWVKAKEWQGRINRLIEVVLRYPMIPALKAMLTWEGVDCGPCLAPRRALTREEEMRLRNELEALK
jgi:N-acetylneuraminate lyase